MIKEGTLTDKGRVTWIDKIFETIPDPLVKVDSYDGIKYRLSELTEIPETAEPSEDAYRELVERKSSEVILDAGVGKLPESMNPERIAQYIIPGFLGGTFIFQTKDDLRCWIDGAKHALYAFAWNKDGKMWVGTTGKTHKEAVAELYAQYKQVTGEDYDE